MAELKLDQHLFVSTHWPLNTFSFQKHGPMRSTGRGVMSALYGGQMNASGVGQIWATTILLSGFSFSSTKSLLQSDQPC